MTDDIREKITAIGSPAIDMSKLSAKLEEYIENWQGLFPDDVIPTVERFSLWCNTDPDLVGKKARRVLRFRRILRRMKALQRLILLNNGAKKDFDSGMSKFILSAVHGLREKADVTSNNKSISLEVRGGSEV